MYLYDALEVGDCVVYSNRENELLGIWTGGSRVVSYYLPKGILDWEAIDTMTIGGGKDDEELTFAKVVMHAADYVSAEV